MIKRSLNQRSIAMIVGTAIAIESAIGFAQVPPARPIRLLIDEGHNNFHTSSGGYAGLTRLLRQDGFSVASHGALTREARLNAEVFLTASPLPEPRNVLLRKIKETGEQMEWSTAASQPAYSPDEVAVVQGWVRNGGSLMLVLDHAPYGITGGALAAAFGVSIANATAFDTAFVKPTPLQAIPGHFLFTRDAGLLGSHPIVSGLTSIVSYTGSSLSGPPEAALLLRLPSTAPARVESRTTSIRHQFRRRPRSGCRARLRTRASDRSGRSGITHN